MTAGKVFFFFLSPRYRPLIFSPNKKSGAFPSFFSLVMRDAGPLTGAYTRALSTFSFLASARVSNG